MEPKYHIANLGELADAQCACVLSTGKMADRMYGRPREGTLDLGNGAVSEKTPQTFDLRCPLSTWQCFQDELNPQR